MSNINKNIPSSEQIRLIFKYTYVLYHKYRNSKTDQDFQNLVKACHELQRRFPFQLCEKILLEICNLIEKEYKSQCGLEKQMNQN
ncbi:hypothetical protein [Anaerocolumna sp.]|uniref:hypothetical protein n=1 Tax=Anaerocolumna sp. TaxID=2041569 RepID=UPI0028AFAF8D|nr:hypothetical protein [Anaerocolumna sp.]